MLETHFDASRLDSWKEIAAYLHRDVRTAIRWGKERGLPIHRVPGGKRQSVFGYTHEIDAWLRSQSRDGIEEPFAESDNPLERGAGSAPTESAASPVIRDNVWLLRRNPWIVAACVVGLIVMGTLFLGSLRSAPIRPMGLRRITDDGNGKGNLRTDGKTLYFTEAQGARSVLAAAPLSGSPVRFIKTPFSNVSLQDLSSDGKTLLILSYDGIIIAGPLWTMPAQGGDPRRVGDAVCDVAQWSPDNRRIACASRTTIAVMNADGSATRTLATFSSPVGRVSWTPDGSRLRFNLEDTTAHSNSTWEIEVAQDGARVAAKRLPLGPGCCMDWTWIDGGKTFVYAEVDSNGKSRLSMRPESALLHDTHATELPVQIGDIGVVSSVHGSNELYLTAGSSYRGELLKLNKQGALETFLPGLSAEYIAFSKDGRWITYKDSRSGALWRSRADGSELLQLTRAPMEVEVSSWSPDGQRIALMGREPGKPWRVYLVDRDGGVLQEASDGDDNQGGPSWSPDGTRIVYGNVFCEKTQNCWIRRINLAARKSEIIPGSNGFRTARWSPDGQFIAALQFQKLELMMYDTKNQRWRMLADSIAGDNVNWSGDSQSVFVDSPRDKKPVIERVWIKGGQRAVVGSLAVQKMPGQIGAWIGLTPDDSPILYHVLGTGEVYALDWAK